MRDRGWGLGALWEHGSYGGTVQAQVPSAHRKLAYELEKITAGRTTFNRMGRELLSSGRT